VPDLTPRQIVAELDRHIVGQDEAKRAVAIAIRNRWRRQRLGEDMRGEVAPKNILMIGPTGVGKTEIARRLATLTGAPFVKVEATKYTEVGYVGRDVESMIRELVENAIGLVRGQERKNVEDEARRRSEEHLLDLLLPGLTAPEGQDPEAAERHRRAREKMRAKLLAGELDERRVELAMEQKAVPMLFTGMGMEQMDFDLQGMFEKILPRHSSRRELSVTEAREVLFEQEVDALINQEKVNAAAVDLAENLGIIFIDEIDKIVAKITDLIPELQVRFPVRMTLKSLSREDFRLILTQPENALTRQYSALLSVDHVRLSFEESALDALAEAAWLANENGEDIGARRLVTIFERLLDDISFNADGSMPEFELSINGDYVRAHLGADATRRDLRQFIL